MPPPMSTTTVLNLIDGVGSAGLVQDVGHLQPGALRHILVGLDTGFGARGHGDGAVDQLRAQAGLQLFLERPYNAQRAGVVHHHAVPQNLGRLFLAGHGVVFLVQHHQQAGVARHVVLVIQGHQEGGGKKKQGVAELKPHRGGARGQEGRDRHLKRGAGRPGDGQAGADGQIDQNGEHSGKGGMDPAGQFCQTPRPHHSDHTQNWEKHRADRQPGHSEPGVHPGLRAQLGWKDQVARTKEH